MSFCTECGAELKSEAKFCPECGSPVEEAGDDDNTDRPNVAEQDSETPSEFEDGTSGGIRWKMVAVGVSMGLLIGFFAAWATLNLGPIAGVAFLIGWIGGGYYIYQKSSVSEGIGSGLYITALLMILTPLLFYIPNVLGGADGTARGTGEFIGSVLGLVIWGFVFFMFALVTAGVGYYFKRRAAKSAAD